MRRGTNLEGESATSISVSIPVQNANLYKHKATSDILLFLTGHRFSDYSIRGIANQIGHSEPSVRRAVNILSSNNLVAESAEGNQRLIRINRERLHVPDDPVLRVPQSEFHEPVKAAVDELVDRLEDIIGIVLYGSVARGEADRRSDIDLWVLTREDRARNQREANAVARDLEGQVFNNERYEYDLDVEAAQAIPTYKDDIQEIVAAGIPVYKTSDFETVENLLMETGDSDE